MAKKLVIIGSIIGSIIAVVLSGVLLAGRYAQHILVWQANPAINVNGIKLMMSEDNVKSLLGKEEEYIQGFGGYILKYQSKGINLTFLNDADTDFYHKVNKIEITNSEYDILGVRVGDNYEKAVNIIRKHGFKKQMEGFPGYWKMNMYIVIEKSHDKVGSIAIGVNDRVAANRVY